MTTRFRDHLHAYDSITLILKVYVQLLYCKTISFYVVAIKSLEHMFMFSFLSRTPYKILIGIKWLKSMSLYFSHKFPSENLQERPRNESLFNVKHLNGNGEQGIKLGKQVQCTNCRGKWYQYKFTKLVINIGIFNNNIRILK